MGEDAVGASDAAACSICKRGWVVVVVVVIVVVMMMKQHQQEGQADHRLLQC